MGTDKDQKFSYFKELKAHLLPLTNCAFNKSGDKLVANYYDMDELNNLL